MASRARFHAPEARETGQELSLGGEEHHHLVRVLRLRPGDPLSLFDGKGRGFSARLVSVDRRQALVRVTGEEAAVESPLHLSLAMALAKGEKLDWVLQKGTELGVSAFHPIASRRSDVRVAAERAADRVARWRRIALEACKQSGRTRLPAIHPPESLQQFVSRDLAGRRVVFDPGGTESLPRAGAGERPAEPVVLAVGPEGGWAVEEVETLRRHGFAAVTLGPRTLRCETAALAAVALLQHLAGDLGSHP